LAELKRRGKNARDC